jgi:tetratricopeptide (TPR) repeat protein
LLLLAWVCLGSTAARAEQRAPRDLWPQATNAIDSGDIDSAFKRTGELTDVGHGYGIRTFPVYADSAAALARQAAKRGQKPIVDWANKAADQLDPTSPAVAFIRADAAADAKNWGAAIPAALRGFAKVFTSYRANLLSRSDMAVVAVVAIVITAAVFAIALFIRYGRAMAHDFREILGQRIRGGAVTVLAFALLFLPLFIWLGPMWLLFYWFVIFFGYANWSERAMIIVLALLLAAAPVMLDAVANWVAGVDNPVLVAAIASEERSYQPEALRRLQDVVTLVPDRPMLQLLLGNLQVQDGDVQAAGNAYRRSIELRDNAGAHVNLGNLHFFDHDLQPAIIEYQKAEQLDSNLAIAFYNHSIAAGEAQQFDDLAKNLDQAKRLDKAAIDRISANPPQQKVVMYRPTIRSAWSEAEAIAKTGAVRTLFGTYAYFDPLLSARNPVTIGGILAVLIAPVLFIKRRRAGFAGSCIKCGRTFCHRCKSARESATYCTQCIHIYLKRDGVSLSTKREKLDQVHDHQTGMLRRNKLWSTFVPGAGQMLEGRTIAGVLGLFLFAFFVALALLTGHLAPVLSPGDVAKIVVRALAVVLAIVTWILLTPAVYRRRMVA